MIPRKPAPDLIRGGNRFSVKHALGLDPWDMLKKRKLDRDPIEVNRITVRSGR